MRSVAEKKNNVQIWEENEEYFTEKKSLQARGSKSVGRVQTAPSNKQQMKLENSDLLVNGKRNSQQTLAQHASPTCHYSPMFGVN